MCFTEILEESLKALGGLGIKPIILDQRFATVRRQEGQLSLRNRFFRVGALGEIRSVLVESPKIQVTNLFFFPDPGRDLPLYVMEFVVAGGKPIAAVLDAPCLLAGLPCFRQVEKEWNRQRRRYGDLRQAEDLPAWYAACRSGHDFFVRQGDWLRLGQAHADLWKAQVAWMAAAGFLGESQLESHRQSIRAYKQHHSIHAPGIPLLRKCFGEAWADEYIAEVLFG